jgi:cell division septation protein DedD
VTEEKDGPVHYQVSVTGRQAAAFFLVLLAALGLSFFFGMKTGAAAKRGPDAVTALAAQSDLAVRPEADEDADAPPTPAPTEAPLGFGSSPEPARRKEPAPTPRPEPVVKEEPAPVPVVKELAPEPTAVPKAAAPAVARGEDGPFWVQLLVTSSAEKADTLAKKLKRDGFRPDVSLVPGKKGLFRVRVGSYPDRARAEAAAKKVQAVEKLGTRPIVVPGGR